MLILGLKGRNLDQKDPKWAELDFYRILNFNFLKENHKISFYTKNQQNLKNRLEYISWKLISDQKDRKWAEPDFSRNFHTVIS